MSDGWQQNLVDGEEEDLADGLSAGINIISDEKDALWDKKVVWMGDLEDVVWQGLNLSTTTKLTLYYDEQGGETSVDQQ